MSCIAPDDDEVPITGKIKGIKLNIRRNTGSVMKNVLLIFISYHFALLFSGWTWSDSMVALVCSRSGTIGPKFWTLILSNENFL